MMFSREQVESASFGQTPHQYLHTNDDTYTKIVVTAPPGDGGGGGGFGGGGGGGGGGAGGGGTGGNPTSPAPPSTYSTEPTASEQIVISEDIVVTAKAQAIAGSHMDQSSYLLRSEQGFQVWRSNDDGHDVVVTGTPYKPSDSPYHDHITWGDKPTGNYNLVYSFHTHPFSGDTPTSDPYTHFTYYGPPSNGDEQTTPAGTFGGETDVSGTTYYWGRGPS